MGIVFKKYLAWQCLKCGRWSGKQNNKWYPGMDERSKINAIGLINLKCTRCRKTTKLRNKEVGGLRVNHQWTDTPQESTIIVQQMQELKRKK